MWFHENQRSTVATIYQYLYGEHPQLGGMTVVGVVVTAAAILFPFGLLEIGFSGLVGTSVFMLVFSVLPGLAGGICGWYRLGFLAATGSGVAPSVAFYLVVIVGVALDIGSFGGGDSPLGAFTLVLAILSFVAAIAGFLLTVAVATLLE